MRAQEMVGKQIAALRERGGMMRADLGRNLAEALGKPWPRQTVSSAEKGRRAFTAEELVAIAHVLGVYPGQLFIPPADLHMLELPGGLRIDRKVLQRPAASSQSKNTLPYLLIQLDEVAKSMNERTLADREVRERFMTFYALLTDLVEAQGGEAP